jgi:hypothetical protein
VAVVGGGRIGLRHFQGLLKMKVPVHLAVVDPVPASLKNCQNILKGIDPSPFLKSVDFFESMEKLWDTVDLVIVATCADVRPRIISDLLAKRTVRNLLLEKVVFQSEKICRDMLNLLETKNVSAWVNCPLRLYPFYRQLGEWMGGGRNLLWQINGGAWGLACNAIHYLDIVSYYSKDLNVAVQTELLDLVLSESKRPGFVEVSGTLGAVFSTGAQVIMSSMRDSRATTVIHMVTPEYQIVIHEVEGTARLQRKGQEGVWEELKFEVCLQSDLTTQVASDILSTGTCGLTPLADSVRLHVPLLKALTAHINRFSQTQFSDCPIT